MILNVKGMAKINDNIKAVIPKIISKDVQLLFVLDESTLSDHNYIEFTVKHQAVEDSPPTIYRTYIGELEKAIEEGRFGVPEINNMNANKCSEAIVQAIHEKCTTMIDPRAKRRRSVHWWTHEIAGLRKDANHARRVY